MGVVAATLAVMSALHLSGALPAGTPPYAASSAGIAEAIICVVLLAGAVAVWRDPGRARPIALAALGFSILGFVVGISITIAGGPAVDIAYHGTVMPVLIVLIAVLFRRTRQFTAV
jgi:ABC-type Fe3+ transport system permease subunit